VEVRFRNRRLERQYLESREAERAYGAEVARKYIQRVNLIRACVDFDELMAQRPLACHPLRGDRAGQYAIKLTGFMRLIITLERGELNVIRIEEVSKHYGD